MNRIDEQLNRLFRAAAQAKPEGEFVPPYGAETRVLAAWRMGTPVEFLWDMSLLVRGLILASLIMGISLWPLMSQSANPFSDYLQLADSTIQVDNTP